MTRKSELGQAHLEGGFIQVANRPGRKAVYKGTVRTRDDKRVLWQCDHVHSRPEYNARYQVNPDLAWEVSALNCGREAHHQWPNPNGEIGIVGDRSWPLHRRDDVRFAKIIEDVYIGRVTLLEDGTRRLRISQDTGPNWTGHIDLDAPVKKGVHIPPTSGEELAKWITAAWLLKGGVWGLVFQDPRVRMDSPGTVKRAIEELLPDREKMASDGYTRIAIPSVENTEGSNGTVATGGATPPKETVQPHIQIGRQGGKRVFEVIGTQGEVVESHVHRGKAVDALGKLKKKAVL